jgi:hypothetical protein
VRYGVSEMQVQVGSRVEPLPRRALGRRFSIDRSWVFAPSDQTWE